MNKKAFSICLLAIMFIMPACNNSGKKVESTITANESEEVVEKTTEETVKETIEGAVTPSNDQAIVDFITEMYNNKSFQDYTFIEKHCSPSLLKKLSDDYDNPEDYEDRGYAVWNFRSGAQDGPSDRHEIISVEQQGDGWFLYTFYDMGEKGSHKIRVFQKDGDFVIEDLI